MTQIVTHESLIIAAITIFVREHRPLSPEAIQEHIQKFRWPVSLEQVEEIWDESVHKAFNDIEESEQLLDRLALDREESEQLLDRLAKEKYRLAKEK